MLATAAVALSGAVVKAALGGMLLTFAARAVASNLPTSPASYAAVATPSLVQLTIPIVALAATP
ncbi:hypothetical protein [Pyrobaculum islandicum]|uniref:hypothetical protein n=1 Tax=Pyrobaculum islandicum TaxID=2277 RepID=UPI000ABF8F70|nr:hypothetical protein [Pyrobaculum islandicum]